MSAVFPLEDDPRWREHVATSGQTVFPVPYPFQDNADIFIQKIGLDGSTTALSEPEHYALTGAGNPTGGSYTLVMPAVAGEKYRSIGDAIGNRTQSVVRAGRYSSAATDTDLDRALIRDLEMKRDIARTFRTDYGQTPGRIEMLPDGHFHKSDGAGNLIDGGSAADITDAQENAEAAAAAAAIAVEALEGSVGAKGDAEAAAEVAIEAAGSVQFPVSYGISQSLSLIQRRQAQANIGLQFRVTPQMFGAIGDGVADDYAAVRACVLSGFPVDWGDGNWIYRIATPLNEAIDHKIDWVSSGATIFYDGEIVQCACQLLVYPHAHTSIGQLLFDAGMKAFVAFDLENAPGTVGAYPDGMPSFYAEDLRATRAYRSSLDFTKGDGIWISGGWSEVSLVRPHVTNCFMAVGAAVPGNQGIFGITVTRNNSTEDSPMRVYIEDCFIDNIANEDATSSSDQDGIRVYSYYQGEVDDPVQSFFRIRGGEIRNCRNRSIKGQMQWGSVEGVKVVKIASEVDPGNLGQSNTADIDLQIGGGSISDIEVYYDGYVPLAICTFGESVRPTKKTSMPVFGNIRGIIKGATLPYVARFVGAPDAGRYNGILRDVNLVGSVNHIVNIAGASGLTGQPKIDVSNVFADIEISAVNFVSGGNLRAFLNGVHNTKRDGGGALVLADLILNGSGNVSRFASAVNCSGFKDYARSTPTQQPAMLRVDAIGSTEGGDSGIIRPISFTVPNDGVIQLPLTGSFGSCIMLFAIGSGGSGSRRSGLLQIASGDVIALTDLGANITVGTTSEPVSGLYRFWASGSANEGPWFANRSGATRTFFAVMIGA